jgi:hypothetical protein
MASRDRARRERFARNEALFREVNERIRLLASEWSSDDDDVIEFTCECANQACAERISATVADYEFVRSDPRRFLVAPGHIDLEVEDVVTEDDAFWIVEKGGEAAAKATELDPRSSP